MNARNARVAVIGDCHGHLQLALCVAARWQQEERIGFEAVFLCGDVGTFTDESQLDNATRRHARDNPCELEFLTQWSSQPPAFWLEYIFKPLEEQGLGLTCPVVMVHGNHEGFAHLARLAPPEIPSEPVPIDRLPKVDVAGCIRLLPSGWRLRTSSGRIVAGVGGIEKGQRQANYHEMAYIDDDAVQHLLDQPKVDLLLTHQGPSAVQHDRGSETLQLLLDLADIAPIWFHGHSTPHPDPVRIGQTLVVPLGDIAFPGRGPDADEPGQNGWAIVDISAAILRMEKKTPPFLREFRRTKWWRTNDDLLICPPLIPLAQRLMGARL
jgi:hypothetical protein